MLLVASTMLWPHMEPVKKMGLKECTIHWKEIVRIGKRGKQIT
jgi:hypothetical protein